jgi:hypothetical protein
MWVTFEIPTPIGTVHRSSSSALQFDVISGAVEMAQARGRLKLMNGCTVRVFSTSPCASPPIRQMLFANTPTTHCLGIARTTAVGPSPHCPVRERKFVAVGNEKTGPSAQVTFPGFDSVK